MDLMLPVLAVTAALSTNSIDLDREQVYCMAENIYHEARGEGALGQVAVAQVTLNRVDSPRYPNTICDVVYDPWQFSWTLDRSEVRDYAAWCWSIWFAAGTMTGHITNNPVGDATHYYNPAKASPEWGYKIEEIAWVGNHRFMRE